MAAGLSHPQQGLEGLEHAAAGHGPTLIELVTYRKGPHTTADDPSAYKASADPGLPARAGDPMLRMRKYLEGLGAWSEQDQLACEAATKEEVRVCVERAENAQAPGIETMFEDVFEHMPQHLQEQQAQCVAGPRARKRH